ncbi:MAG: S-formylglutathione hydrolase [Pseudohongiellaceae bacterium]|jgi:S-formylglutathione hydrolase
MELISNNRCYNGAQQRFSHYSQVLNCEMNFSIYLPDTLKHAETGSDKMPVLTFLAGLTGTDESFPQKGGAQRLASELGIVIVTPDTSPRGTGIPDDPDGQYDFGLGAGFYLNATQSPWQKNYRMYDYVTQELRQLVATSFPVDDTRHGIMGHSMGGHGALTIALKNTHRYTAVSAFAPIVSPPNCPWGVKALSNYLGEDRDSWSEYDSAALIKKADKIIPMLVDQGTLDQFLDTELKPELLIKAASACGYPLEFMSRGGYDHSYYFISTFVGEHLKFHAKHFGL